LRSIVVCPLSQLNHTLENSGAKRVISLLSGDTGFERPLAISRDNHLLLRFNDITTAQEGLISPSERHVADIIEFAKSWNWSTPLLIHCWAGISRSPAAAAIVALALNPDRNDGELAQALRKLAPPATPNIRMIEIADQTLGRGGRFKAAVEKIGRGKDAFEGNVFVLETAKD